MSKKMKCPPKMDKAKKRTKKPIAKAIKSVKAWAAALDGKIQIDSLHSTKRIVRKCLYPNEKIIRVEIRAI